MGKRSLLLWFCLLLLTLYLSSAASCEPYTVSYPQAGLQTSISVPTEVKAGSDATFTVTLSSERSLDVVVRVSYIYGRGNVSGWAEVYRGALGPQRSVEVNCTFKVPVSAETGPLIMWVYLEFAGEEDREIVAGEEYYADWSFIVVGPYVVSGEDLEREERVKELNEELEALKRERKSLVRAVDELSLAIDNLTRQLEAARQREAEARLISENLEGELNNTLRELSRVKEELEAAKAENEELSRRVTLLMTAVFVVSVLTALLLAMYLKVKRKCAS